MPRVIFKCPYKKPGAGRAGYVTYIATRDGVEKIKNPDAPATKKQQDYIEKLLQDFPEAKQSEEYQTFEQNPTMGNASALISASVDEFAEEMVGADGYVNYIATRPRAEKNGNSHGLFAVTGDPVAFATPVDLQAVAMEIEHHPGNLWMPIISLKREDAVAMKMDSAKACQKFLSEEKNHLAKLFGIDPEHFRAYAAFHDEKHHPHIHMVCYSTNPKEGFLTKTGIHNIKSHLTTKIFAEELRPLYEKKTAGRTAVKQEAQEALGQILEQMEVGHLQNARIEKLMVALGEKLSVTAGKKQYGYLGAELKNLVDEIVRELAKDERVSKAYELWWDCKEKIDQGYHEKASERIPLVDCNDFRSIRNMIINEASSLSDAQLITSVTGSAEQESVSAKTPLPHRNAVREESTLLLGTRLLRHVSRIFRTTMPPAQTAKQGIDKKLRRQTKEKKIALGHHQDDDEQQLTGQQ